MRYLIALVMVVALPVVGWGQGLQNNLMQTRQRIQQEWIQQQELVAQERQARAQEEMLHEERMQDIREQGTPIQPLREPFQGGFSDGFERGWGR